MTDGLEQLANENGEVWGGSRRDLESKLATFYEVGGVALYGDWYDEENDEMLYEVFVVREGEDEYLIDEDVCVFGHFESGAVGVDIDDLPEKREVREKVSENEPR